MTYGFPEDKPDSFDADGNITSNSGQVMNQRAIQLFARQIGAGTGMNIRGYSGAPVVVKRKTKGFKDGKEEVVVGLLSWSPTNIDGFVTGGTVYARPMNVILARCRGTLSNYDNPWRKLGRWSCRVGPRLLRLAVSVLAMRVPLWVVLPFLPIWLPWVVLNWPEEWAIRSSFGTDSITCTPTFSSNDKDFQIGSSSGVTDHDELSGLLLNIWKKWTTKGVQRESFLVVRLPQNFKSWYKNFDLEVHVSFIPQGEANASAEMATIETAAAFLVKEKAYVEREKALPRFRQLLVFVDFAEDDKNARRPCILHMLPPNPGENLLLLLRVSSEKPLPADSTRFSVVLQPTKGPYP
jgi:hypothetical protein